MDGLGRLRGSPVCMGEEIPLSILHALVSCTGEGEKDDTEGEFEKEESEEGEKEKDHGEYWERDCRRWRGYVREEGGDLVHGGWEHGGDGFEEREGRGRWGRGSR